MSDSRNPFNTGLSRFLAPELSPGTNALSGLLAPSPQLGLTDIARLFSPQAATTPFGLPTTSPLVNALARNALLGDGGLADLERWRLRREWNDRFEHWERPASGTEESAQHRAKRMVADAVSDAVWLTTQRATIEPQGSAHNNTNTRRDADVDLRVQLPLIKVEYSPNVLVGPTHMAGVYTPSGWTYDQLFTMMRWDLEICLVQAFGKANVIPGKKAFRVKGITGSRAEVDVVPALGYHLVWWWEAMARFETIEGVAILSTDGRWTINYPDQHSANGVAKRTRTNHQFKKVVRIFKRLRADLSARGLLRAKIPSFLVECLVYLVEDGYFTVLGDDRYDRVRRVARRLQAVLRAPSGVLREINELKPLFTSDQAWTYQDACQFADALVAHLGDA